MRTDSRRDRSVARATKRVRRKGEKLLAITGTPGVGKSAVARRLSADWFTVEVGDLAVALGVGRRRGSGVVVDLPAMRERVRTWRPPRSPVIVVGHLSHRLPVQRAFVLRCHPAELRRRLKGDRRGSRADRIENLVAEATDVVLSDALARVPVVVEIDTTGRSIAAVARDVARGIRGPSRSRRVPVDWLSDPSVTDHLLDPDR